MHPDLTGHVAVVTGAGRGIGRAIGMSLARCGAHVVLAARSHDQLDEVAAEIGDFGGATTTCPLDLGDEAQILHMFRQVETQHGRLDVLVNNAGIGIYGPVVEYATEDLDRVLQVNLRGSFLCCREAMKLMVPASSGYIINISSVVGFKGYPNQAAYTATKHGIMGLTKSLSVEAQEHGIRVSAILPGGVDTEMVGQARPDLDRSILLQPDDIAQTVLYLLSLSDRAAVDQIYIRRRTSAPF
jgi:3-oxoacyl-[acyl-carrier protein] reductase